MIPKEYTEYLANGATMEGELNIATGWYQLWSMDEIPVNNRTYEIHEFAPGLLGFGSNGGGEILAFTPDGKVVTLPFVGMSPDTALVIAKSWADFEKAMVK